jgi:hypothetical protein
MMHGRDAKFSNRRKMANFSQEFADGVSRGVTNQFCGLRETASAGGTTVRLAFPVQPGEELASSLPA